MVSAAPEFEVGIALLALLRPEVLKVLWTLLSAAQLELKIDPGAIVTSIDGHWVVALACAEANPSSTGP